MASSWAGRENVSTVGAFETLHSGLTVELISTHRNALKTCASGDTIADVMERNVEKYDFLPVTARSSSGADSVIGLLNAAKVAQAATLQGCVREHFDALSETLLIGADVKILDFIKDADCKPCRLVVSDSGIVGLVSLSNLQKLPVRAVLFAIITGFEITMMELIRETFQNDQDWLSCLSEGRQSLIRKIITESHDNDSFVESLLFTQFCDKADIIKKSFEVPGESKGTLAGKFGEIQKLRDHVAHANEYATSAKKAENVCVVIRNTLDLRDKLVATRRSATA
jgi:hypothetical protein